MACGNCHTPRDADGKPIAGQGAVGRPRLQYAGLRRHRAQHHARQGNRDRKLERHRDQARAGRGVAPGSWPARRHSAGRDHAGQFLQGAAARRPRRHHRLFAQRRRRSATKSPIPSTRSRCAAIPIPTPTPDSARPCWPIPSGAAPISSRSAIAWNATRPGRAACPISRPASAPAAGRSRRATDRRRARRQSPSPTSRSHPTAGIGAWTDAEIGRAITHGVARDGRPLKPPMAYGYYAALKDADLADIVAYLRTVPPRP